jgi:hypothetical protein
MTKLEQLKKDEAELWQKLSAIEESAKAIRVVWQPIYAELKREEMRAEILKEAEGK